MGHINHISSSVSLSVHNILHMFEAFIDFIVSNYQETPDIDHPQPRTLRATKRKQKCSHMDPDWEGEKPYPPSLFQPAKQKAPTNSLVIRVLLLLFTGLSLQTEVVIVTTGTSLAICYITENACRFTQV